MGTKADPFDYFPVDGAYHYSDDFGYPRPGGRTHQGNDIFCAKGTRLVSPFAGVLTPFASPLCGVGYHITGPFGHVTGCHLDRLAHVPGPIRAGALVGYADNTGNAVHTSTHLHFEWHPGLPGAPAVDPFPFLQAAEGKVAPKAKGGGGAIRDSIRTKPANADGSCPKGYLHLSDGNPNTCYHIGDLLKGGNPLNPILHPESVFESGGRILSGLATGWVKDLFKAIAPYLSIGAGGLLLGVALWIALREVGAPVPSPPQAATGAARTLGAPVSTTGSRPTPPPPAPVRTAAEQRTAERSAEAESVAAARERGRIRGGMEGASIETVNGQEFEAGPPFNRANYNRRAASRRRMEATASKGRP